MTQLVGFAPSTEAVFQFQAVFGGTQYVIACPWNAFGERWYITVSDLAGDVVAHRPIVQSGPRYQATLTWADNLATIVTSAPHELVAGWLAQGRVYGSGTPFDGFWEVLAVDEQTLTFNMPVNPQQSVAVTGSFDFPLDLLAGYGIGPLYFHASTQQFEY